MNLRENISNECQPNITILFIFVFILRKWSQQLVYLLSTPLTPLTFTTNLSTPRAPHIFTNNLRPLLIWLFLCISSTLISSMFSTILLLFLLSIH